MDRWAGLTHEAPTRFAAPLVFVVAILDPGERDTFNRGSVSVAKEDTFGCERLKPDGEEAFSCGRLGLPGEPSGAQGGRKGSGD